MSIMFRTDYTGVLNFRLSINGPVYQMTLQFSILDKVNMKFHTMPFLEPPKIEILSGTMKSKSLNSPHIKNH